MSLERRDDLVQVSEEWRVVEDFPQYEVNIHADIRKTKNKKHLKTKDGHRLRVRVVSDGFKLSIPVRYLRNEAFYDVDPM